MTEVVVQALVQEQVEAERGVVEALAQERAVVEAAWALGETEQQHALYRRMQQQKVPSCLFQGEVGTS